MGLKKNNYFICIVVLFVCCSFFGCGQNETSSATETASADKTATQNDVTPTQDVPVVQEQGAPVRPQGKVPVVVPQISQKSELPNIRIVEPENQEDVIQESAVLSEGSGAENSEHTEVAQDQNVLDMNSTLLRSSLQLITVVTPSWSSHLCVMQLYSRYPDDNQWKAQGSSWPCVVGRNGLAWGRGTVAINDAGLRKREGDGKSPAGMFDVLNAFGRTSVDKAKALGVALNYREITPETVCINQPGTPLYNRIMDINNNSDASGLRSESMFRSSATNTWGLIIEHNTKNPVDGAGTCVFVNVWPGARRPTGGSIGSDVSHMQQLVAALDPQKKPALVVLPKPVYQEKIDTWGLPPLGD